MSNGFISAVIGTRTGLGPREKLVLVILADMADALGSCFPRRAVISARSELSISTVHRILVRLEKDGWIKVQRRRGRHGRQGASVYTLQASRLSIPESRKDGTWNRKVPIAPWTQRQTAESTGEKAPSGPQFGGRWILDEIPESNIEWTHEPSCCTEPSCVYPPSPRDPAHEPDRGTHEPKASEAEEAALRRDAQEAFRYHCLVMAEPVDSPRQWDEDIVDPIEPRPWDASLHVPAIVELLRTGRYGLDDLLRASWTMSRDRWWRGENPYRKELVHPKMLFTRDRLDYFINVRMEPPGGGGGAKSLRDDGP